MAMNSIVVIKRGTLSIVERRTTRGKEDVEKYRKEMLDKYDDNVYDIVVTYGGVFDIRLSSPNGAEGMCIPQPCHTPSLCSLGLHNAKTPKPFIP